MTETAATEPKAPRADWHWLFGIMTALLAAALPMSAYSASLAIIQEEWGMTNSQAGLVNSATAVGSVIAALVIAPMTDRLRADRVLITAGLSAALAQILFPLVAHNFGVAMTLRFFVGLSISGIYVTGTRVVAERFALAGRGTATGLYVTTFYLGSGLSFTLIGAFIPLLGWRGATTLFAGLSFLTPIVLYLILRGYRPSGVRDTRATLDLSVLKSKPASVMIFGYFMHSIELSHLRTWLTPFLAFVLVAYGGFESEHAAARAAVIFGIWNIVGAAAPFLGGVLSDRVGRLRAAIALCALSAACSMTMGWIGGAPWAMVLALSLVYTITTGADSAIYTTSVTEVAIPGKMGSTLAVHGFFGFAAGIVSPALFGGLLDITGRESLTGWGLGFATAGIGGLLAVLAMLWLMRIPAAYAAIEARTSRARQAAH
ncbi:MAG: MFS transporter [Chloroflexi bacterium]|nr:MFS transporter [Chloroflexota bacterium]